MYNFLTSYGNKILLFFYKYTAKYYVYMINNESKNMYNI